LQCFHNIYLEKVNHMGITKLIVYLITVIFIGFPIGMHQQEMVQTPDENYSVKVAPPPLSVQQANIVDSLLNRRLTRNGFRGAVLVAYQDQIIMEYAHGYADYKARRKINVQSTFQLASVSKSFTSTSIMILKDKGLLNLNDVVVKYIPEFPYEDIKISHLLQHTAGLQNYMYLVDNYWKNDSLITNEDILDLLVKYHLPLNNRPGRRFLYSNTGYAILALLVERVSKESFADFVKENIFQACGMDNTYTFSYQVIDTVSNRAIGYNRRGRRLFRYDFEPNDMILGDKSVFSNVEDLFKYDRALNSYKLVSKESLTEAYTKGKTTSRYPRVFDYGFGWRIKDENGNHLIYHNGLWHGFTSTITHEVNSDITIIMLNNTTASISAIKRDLLRITKTELQKLGIINEETPSTIASLAPSTKIPNS